MNWSGHNFIVSVSILPQIRFQCEQITCISFLFVMKEKKNSSMNDVPNSFMCCNIWFFSFFPNIRYVSNRLRWIDVLNWTKYLNPVDTWMICVHCISSFIYVNQIVFSVLFQLFTQLCITRKSANHFLYCDLFYLAAVGIFNLNKRMQKITISIQLKRIGNSILKLISIK